MKLIIDASTQGSGGGKRHLNEILKEFIKGKYPISKIYIWAPLSLLKILPENPLIIKKTTKLLNKGLFTNFIWQFFFRDSDFRRIDHDCIYSPYGNYNGKIRPYITMSRNMLMFEDSERKKFGISFLRLKLKILSFIQKKSFINSNGIIFLSKYAKRYITKKIGHNFISSKVINHGVSSEFRKKPKKQLPISTYSNNKPFKFLYVSNILPYKYHLNILSAIGDLLNNGYPIQLTLVGKVDSELLGRKVSKQVKLINKKHNAVKWFRNVNITEVKNYYHSSDCFIFASSCENMPNILIEAMSSGLPIICSNRGPMSEFLKDSGLYFDPQSVDEIKKSTLEMINNCKMRDKLSKKSYQLSLSYSWEKCAQETIQFILSNFKKYKNV